MNKAILTANLTRDPELSYSQAGKPFCRLGLACNTKFADKEETLFIDGTVFGKQAESCAQYLRKGRPVLVTGRIRRDEWDDKQTGQRKHKTGLVLEHVEFLNSRGDSNNEARTTNQERSSNVGCPDPDSALGHGADDDVPF
jgi:single-strand DNA-binding protein